MIKDNCIFCKIVAGEIPSVKIWENDKFLAILDLFPNREGMTLVLPKDHYDSDVFLMGDDILQEYILAVKEVTNLLKSGLSVDRIGTVFEWLKVDHAHFRLYPFYNWVGFVDWVAGWKQVNIDDLRKIADKILKK